MNDIDEKIIRIKRELDDINAQKIANITRLKSLENEKEELLRECKLLSVDPSNIELTIKEQEAKVQAEIEEVQRLLGEFNAFRT